MLQTDVKTDFARRLHDVCDDLGLLPGRGRQTALAKRFGLTPNAARKWLLGIGMPELDKAIEIANAARVNVLWLLQGAGPKRGDAFDTTPGELLEAVQQLPANEGQQVFDFIRYKIERADGWFAADKLANYMLMLDKLGVIRSSAIPTARTRRVSLRASARSWRAR